MKREPVNLYQHYDRSKPFLCLYIRFTRLNQVSSAAIELSPENSRSWLIRQFEKQGHRRARILARALDTMLTCDAAGAVWTDPKNDPLVVVANHPHGMVRRIFLRILLSGVRPD